MDYYERSRKAQRDKDRDVVILGVFLGALLSVLVVLLWSAFPYKDFLRLLGSLNYIEIRAEIDNWKLFAASSGVVAFAAAVVEIALVRSDPHYRSFSEALLLWYAYSRNDDFNRWQRESCDTLQIFLLPIGVIGFLSLAVSSAYLINGSVNSQTIVEVFIVFVIALLISFGVIAGSIALARGIADSAIFSAIYITPNQGEEYLYGDERGIARFKLASLNKAMIMGFSLTLAILGLLLTILNATLPQSRSQQIAQLQTWIAATSTSAPLQTAIAATYETENTQLAILAATLNQVIPTPQPSPTTAPNALATQLAQVIVSPPTIDPKPVIEYLEVIVSLIVGILTLVGIVYGSFKWLSRRRE